MARKLKQPPKNKEGQVLPLKEACMVKLRRRFRVGLASYDVRPRSGTPIPKGVVLPKDALIVGPIPEDMDEPQLPQVGELTLEEAKAKAQEIVEEAMADAAKIRGEAQEEAAKTATPPEAGEGQTGDGAAATADPSKKITI